MKVINSLKGLVTQNRNLQPAVAHLSAQVDEAKILAAKQLILHMKSQGIYGSIHDAEFKVFSQFSDDGIIQYLIHNCQITSKKFVEFGVENYLESNTRFLLMNNNWSGFVMDGSDSHVRFIQQQDLYWKYDLTAVRAFISKDNVNELISSNGFDGDLGILSIDIDGNDYWIWDAIDSVGAAIVICEFNSLFGATRAVTIPYDPNFDRTAAHYSNLYWGCSIKALCLLAERRNYKFVGCNSNGNNAYFVRADRIGKIRALSATEGYVESKFKESRDKDGRLNFIRSQGRLKQIAEMPLFDLEGSKPIKVKDLQ